jgi:hypothetical protein
MKTTWMHRLFAACLLAALANPALAVGPLSTLYVTNYLELSGNTVTGLDLIQGVTENSFPTSFTYGINIAVYGDVRTMGYSDTQQGERFDLAGTQIAGGPYTNSLANSQLHDGTSDGNYNYSVDYTTGDVLRYDRNWASPASLFNASAGVVNAGWITMDVSDGSFWISQWGAVDLVGHFTSTGTLLGTFNSGVVGPAGLALDPADGTLWMGDYLYQLHQFSQGGTALQTVPYSVTGGGWYGMEFDTTPVPEPGSLALAAMGLAGVVACLRRRRVQR